MKGKIGIAIIFIIGISLIVVSRKNGNEPAKHDNVSAENNAQEDNKQNRQYRKNILDTIYLYQGEEVVAIKKDNDKYKKLTDEIMYIINNPYICGISRGKGVYDAGIDGELDFEGNGKKFKKGEVLYEECGKGYILEVNFNEPINTSFSGNNHSGIRRIVIIMGSQSLLYIYKKYSPENKTSFAGYMYEDKDFENLYSIAEDYFSNFKKNN